MANAILMRAYLGGYRIIRFPSKVGRLLAVLFSHIDIKKTACYCRLSMIHGKVNRFLTLEDLDYPDYLDKLSW